MSVASADLHVLLRAIRAARLGEEGPELPAQVAGYGALGLLDLCLALRTSAQGLANGSTIGRRELEIWEGFYGLNADPPRPLGELGADWGIGSERAGQLRRLVEHAVAEEWPPQERQPTTLARPDIGAKSVAHHRLAGEQAIASLHADRAADGSEPDVRAIEVLARELLGNPRRRRSTDSPPRLRDSSAHRRRRQLRAEIALRRSLEIPPSPRRLIRNAERESIAATIRSVPETVIDRDVALKQFVTSRPPDLDFLRWLVIQSDSARKERQPYLAPLLALVDHGFRQYEISPDPEAEAAGLLLNVTRLREAEQMGAYALARRIEALVGPGHPVAIQAMDDSALVLRANHYLRLSEHILARTRTIVRQHPPTQVTTGFMFSNISTYAVMAASAISLPGGSERVQRSYHQLGDILTAIERRPEILGEWKTVFMRRQLQLDLAVALMTRQKVHGRYRLSLPRASTAWKAEAALAAKVESGPWPMGWALQEMRVALAARDPEEFWASRDRAAHCHGRQPFYANLVYDFDRLVTSAKGLGWQEPSPITLVPPDDDAMRLTRPDRLGVV